MYISWFVGCVASNSLCCLRPCLEKYPGDILRAKEYPRKYPLSCLDPSIIWPLMHLLPPYLSLATGSGMLCYIVAPGCGHPTPPAPYRSRCSTPPTAAPAVVPGSG